MILLHESLNAEKFKNDKKLNLLKQNVINVTQFVNLIEITDQYTMIGPVIVDKEKVQSFIEDWKNNNAKTTPISSTSPKFISQPEIITKLDDIVKYFPEIEVTVSEFKKKLENQNSCPQCVKNKYILSIIGTIKPLYQDGRDLKDMKEFIETIVNRYYPISGKLVNSNTLNSLDVDWIKPDSLIALRK